MTAPVGRAHGDGRPVFVVGMQRSGTTLLQSLLGSHPAIAAPPELHFFFRVAMQGPAWGDLEDDAVLRQVVETALHPPLGLLDEAGFDDEAVLERARSGPRTWPALLDAILTDFAERHHKPRWSEKSPGQPMEIMGAWYPDAQFVHIVRDPRDCVASNVRAPWGERDAGVLARRWRAHTLETIRVGSRVGPDRYLRIRYEDLVADPEATLRVVFAFLDEPFDPALLDDVEARRSALAPAAAPFQRRLLERPSRERRRPDGRTRMARVRAGAVNRSLLAPLGYVPAGTSALAAGHAANVALLPRAVPALRWRIAARRAAKHPERLPDLVARYEARAMAPIDDPDT